MESSKFFNQENSSLLLWSLLSGRKALTTRTCTTRALYWRCRKLCMVEPVAQLLWQKHFRCSVKLFRWKFRDSVVQRFVTILFTQVLLSMWLSFSLRPSIDRPLLLSWEASSLYRYSNCKHFVFATPNHVAKFLWIPHAEVRRDCDPSEREEVFGQYCATADAVCAIREIFFAWHRRRRRMYECVCVCVCCRYCYRNRTEQHGTKTGRGKKYWM